MSEKILQAQVALACCIDRIRKSEFGQGSTEYAGLIVIVVILMGVVAGGAHIWGGDLSDGISNQIRKIFEIS